MRRIRRNLKSFIVLTLIIFVVFYIFKQPKSTFVDDHNVVVQNIVIPAPTKKILWETPDKERSANQVYGENGESAGNFDLENVKDSVLKAYQAYGFNQYASDLISLDRTLADVRHPTCHSKQYMAKLPNVSVIIIFYDEGWSTLMRTVHSVINRSPKSLLKEIILVDDHSTMSHLGQELDTYVGSLSVPVHVIRLPKHDGLISARIQGAAFATGESLIFLDSHCEVSFGWLPPLLEPIAIDYRTVTCPMIDVIDHKNFKYVANNARTQGYFSWLFYYKEYNKPLGNEESFSDNIKSPVMAGGLFAISRQWWNELGGYDPDLYVWGGEQYELSFKLWMCGGKMLNVPCSHVGHIYRGPHYNRNQQDINERHPNSLMKNYKRVAEIWMDEYKNFLYANNINVAKAVVSEESMAERKRLREKLQCNSFEWYLRNIIGDMLKTRYEPDLALDKIVLMKTDKCLSSSGNNQPIKLMSCSVSMEFRYTWIGEFKEDEHCFTANAMKSSIGLAFCQEQRDNQYFGYDTKTKKITLKSSGSCITGSSNGDVFLSKCSSENDDFQMWEIKLKDRNLITSWAMKAIDPARDP